MTINEQAVEQTRKWISEVVIGCNFCPFAAREFQRNSIRYTVPANQETEAILHTILEECTYLDENPGIETTLVIVPEALEDFRKYLDVLFLAEDAMAGAGYEGVYQLASFHPDYRFEGAPTDDPANYTNRSPYPVFHLLREDSVEKALEFYKGNPDEIPEKNIEFARTKGLAYMKMLLESCR